MERIRQMRRGDAAPPLVLLIVCAGVVLASLDLFIVNLALPSIARDLRQSSLGSLSWVLNGYTIVYASLLVLLGRLAERRQRDLAFLLGVLIFTASSAACAAAPSLAALVLFRVVQAVGAALLTPASLSLVLATTPSAQRAASVRAWTAVGGIAAGLGPVIGGLLVTVSWRLVFVVNLPIGLLACLLGWRYLPKVPGHEVRSADPMGAVLVTFGVGGLSVGLVEGNSWGWASVGVISSLVASLVLLSAAIIHTLGHRNPLIDPKLFRDRAFSGASVVVLLFSIAFGAMLLSVVLWMQDVWGWSALKAGLAFAPGPLLVPVFALFVSSRVIARIGSGPVIAIGAVIYMFGNLWWATRIGLAPDYVTGVLPGTLLTGSGVGLTLPTTVATGAASLPPESLATGSGALNMFRQVGLAIGVAVLIAVVEAEHGGQHALHAFHNAWLAISGFSFSTAIAGLAMLHRRRRAVVPPFGMLVSDEAIRVKTRVR
jgi:EmrB/QacA subfamily drug resistance transporter